MDALTRKELFDVVLARRDPETGLPDIRTDDDEGDALERAAVANGMSPQAAREWARLEWSRRSRRSEVPRRWQRHR